jgi:protein-S-isoprenylcysteine O-methyltransferase Ste14
MTGISIAIFLAGTLVIGLFTWQFAVKAKRPHGIPRFFAFECILLLILLNQPVWFEQPFTWSQLISWILLLGSIITALYGFILLHRIGKPQGDFENTSNLVAVGLYKFIRHPLYASLMMLGFGVYFKHMTIITTALAFFNFVALIATAKKEEKEMQAKFGEEYIAYMKNTKMFIPFVF